MPGMPDDDLEEARRRHESDIVELGNLDDGQLDYLTRLADVEDPDTDGIEHDEEPKLTGEEWEYVRAMNDG
jgi:hypothetical protein